MKKLAVIGCGEIGNYHLKHFLKYNDIELAGFCDLIPERAEGFAVRVNNAKTFTDYKAMYDSVNPDMVFICIPPSNHGEIEYETIKRRIPFFVEKPVALSMELARRISAEVAKAGLITAVGFQCRYSSLVKPSIEYIRENEVVFIDCVRVGGVPGAPWWKVRSLSGGQIVEQTVHQFDIIRYVFGEPETVFTMGTRGFVNNIEGYDTEDLSTTVVRFKSGTLATISTGCYATGGSSADSKITFSARDTRAELKILTKFEMFGIKSGSPLASYAAPAAAPAAAAPATAAAAGSGTAVSSGAKTGGFVTKNDGALSASSTGPIMLKDDGTAGDVCDRTFVDAVLSGDGSKIRSPYSDAVKTLAFVLACNQSMDTSLPVKIEI